MSAVKMSLEEALVIAEEGEKKDLRGAFPMAARVLAAEIERLREALKAVGVGQKVFPKSYEHSNCKRVPHNGTGYLHDEEDDTPVPLGTVLSGQPQGREGEAVNLKFGDTESIARRNKGREEAILPTLKCPQYFCGSKRLICFGHNQFGIDWKCRKCGLEFETDLKGNILNED